ncbi:hypothetical protein [Sphingosinicella rhizophila]|uniref:Uncharacterized protein n=1 Tax=Sphingosinicella rhizophila TaxID=3050082 RepID=A0ABU3Q6U0_9SPHN|nr:hypothetical protein [Sphingosinicella sp. GR2756]MDT9599118.1 hypothetical protein [Sphingosinicella sp. GR2756]
MRYYRICFDTKERSFCFDEFLAEDDVQALREAEQHVDGEQEAVLWCGERRVSTVRSKADAKPVHS